MQHNSILALDVGAKRVGVAVASIIAQLPRPLITLDNDDSFMTSLQNIIEVEDVGAMIVGYPRDMKGDSTQQTREVEEFTAKLRQEFAMPIIYQDEALTSKHAEAELDAKGKNYVRGDIDSLAATYILQDFLNDPKNINGLEL